jgi:3-oxoacyl-[acyl-carrier protein] reductase
MTRGKAPYSETMTPINRLGRPEDVAHGVRYLVSPRAQYITGTTLHMNGGLFMR